MTRLIRSGHAALAQVRAFTAPARQDEGMDAAPSAPEPAPVEPVDTPFLALEREAASLRQEVERQNAVAAKLRDEIDKAFRRGEAAGREAGQREAEDQSERALTTFSDGVERALAVQQASAAALEPLAVLLARAGLRKVLGDADQFDALVIAVIQRQLADLAADTVLRIEVSALDFPDPVALERLEAAVARPGLEVVALAERPAGDCQIQLKLGRLDAGLGGQWARLGALFDEAVEEAPA